MPNYRLRVHVKGGVGNLIDEPLIATDDAAAIAAAKEYQSSPHLGLVESASLTNTIGDMIWKIGIIK